MKMDSVSLCACARTRASREPQWRVSLGRTDSPLCIHGSVFGGALAGVPGSPVQTAVCGGGFFVAELAGQNPDGSLCSSCIQSCLLEVGDFLGNQLQLRNLAHRKKLICIRIQLRLQLRNLACRKKLICLRNSLQPRNPAHRKKFIRLGI